MRDSANLDLLRSFAVLCVFFCHLPFAIGRWDGIGIAGVILFFIHTSYVLLLSLQRNGDSWAGFQVRRIFRIYPLAILALLSYWSFRFPYASAGREYVFLPITVKDAIANFALIQNITGNKSVPAVVWSLPYELQMYLALPLIFWLCARYERRGAVTLYVCAVVIIAPALVLLPPSSLKSVILLLEFVPCFLAGALLFTAPRRARFHWSGILVILVAVASASVLPVFKNDIAQWIVCLGVALTLPFFSEVSSAFLRSVFKTVAKYSYGVYLSHYAAIQIALRITHNAASVVALSMVMTALFSLIAFHLIEQPFINYGKAIAARLTGSKYAKASYAASSS